MPNENELGLRELEAPYGELCLCLQLELSSCHAVVSSPVVRKFEIGLSIQLQALLEKRCYSRITVDPPEPRNDLGVREEPRRDHSVHVVYLHAVVAQRQVGD